MKNFMNYICLFLMILGINVSANAATITPNPTSKNIQIEGTEASGTFTIDVTTVGLTNKYGAYLYANLDTYTDYDTYDFNCYFGTKGNYVLNTQNGVLTFSYEILQEGEYSPTLTLYGYESGSYEYVSIDVPITINVTAPQPQVVLTNYQTYCPRTVTFNLNGLQGEAPAPILTKKNLTITAPSDPVTPEGITFLGWYNGDTKWNFESDLVTEDMQLSAKCQSALVISGNVHLTSGKDVQVYTTPATNNMITVSWFGKDVAEATKIRFSYYLNGQKVTDDTQSPFRVCNADNYNMVSGNIDNAGENFEQTFAVSYKPTAYNQLDNYTIRVEAVNDAGKQVYRSADLAVYGRSLPEQFVIAIKKDNQWYAVPNVLATSSSATAEQQPAALEIDVNDSNNPTYAKTSDNATNALYKSAGRQTAGEHRGAIRLQSVVNNNYITATTSNNTYFYMKSGNDQNQQFYLNSTDCNVYKVTLDPAEYTDNTPNRWMSINGSKIGWYTTQACNVYFLPVKAITEKIEVNDEQTVSLSEYEVDETTTVIVHAGGIFNADKVATIGTLQIEKTGDKSGQVFETEPLTTNNAYFDVTLNAAPRTWYDFAVPFKVNRNSISLANGAAMPEYDIIQYNGETRATNGANKSAWEYVDEGDLNPGTFYMIMFASNVETIRFTKNDDAVLNNAGEVVVADVYESSNPLDANWNGIANNTLQYVNLGFTEDDNANIKAQVYNPGDKNYTTYNQDEVTFVVGAPFFVQVAIADKVAWETTPINDILRAPSNATESVGEFTLELIANGVTYDRLFVSASEDATDSYQIGHDLAKMGVSTTVAQMWINNYNTKLCANEAVLINGQATYQMEVFVPEAGEYKIAITSAPENATLYLTIDGQVVWNLSESAYVANLTKGTHSEFGLLLIAEKRTTPTNINGLKGNNKAQKIFKDYNIYILRDAQMYNTQGVKVQ